MAARTAEVTVQRGREPEPARVLRFSGNTFLDLRQRLAEVNFPGYNADSFLEIKMEDGSFVCLLDDEQLPEGTVHLNVHTYPCGSEWIKPSQEAVMTPENQPMPPVLGFPPHLAPPPNDFMEMHGPPHHGPHHHRHHHHEGGHEHHHGKGHHDGKGHHHDKGHHNGKGHHHGKGRHHHHHAEDAGEMSDGTNSADSHGRWGRRGRSRSKSPRGRRDCRSHSPHHRGRRHGWGGMHRGPMGPPPFFFGFHGPRMFGFWGRRHLGPCHPGMKPGRMHGFGPHCHMHFGHHEHRHRSATPDMGRPEEQKTQPEPSASENFADGFEKLNMD